MIMFERYSNLAHRRAHPRRDVNTEPDHAPEIVPETKLFRAELP